jgi:magnesium transporter
MLFFATVLNDPRCALTRLNCKCQPPHRVPEGADSILIQLEQRIRGGSLEVENSIFGSELGPDASSDLLASDTNSHHGRRALIDKAKELIRDDKLSSNDSSHTNPRSIIRQKVKTAASSLLRSATESNKSDGDSDGCMSDAETEAISEWEEMQANQWVDLPFELQAADSVLFVVCSILSQDAFELQEETLGYIHDVLSSQSGLQDDPLMGIRHIKDANREMSSRIKGFVQSMNRILDDDEDMALMNLSRLRTHPHRFVQPVPKEVLDEEADEPELILEAHLQVGLTLTNALDLIHGQIETASELVDQKLDASRNRLLFTNMVLNLLTLCVTMGTFVAGIFGMNLRSFMEDSESAFFSVVYGTVAGMFGSLFLMMAGLMYLGIMPRWFPTFT